MVSITARYRPIGWSTSPNADCRCRQHRALHDELFSEVTYHASYEPMRAIRTNRYKYIHRFDGRLRPVLANVDDGPSKQVLLDFGWSQERPAEELPFDLVMDPNESHNLAGDPKQADTIKRLRERLAQWMEETNDPLRQGSVLPSEDAVTTWPDASSPAGPLLRGANRPAG